MDKVLSVARRYDGSAQCNLRDGHTARGTVCTGLQLPGPLGENKYGRARANFFFSTKSGPNQRHVRRASAVRALAACRG